MYEITNIVVITDPSNHKQFSVPFTFSNLVSWQKALKLSPNEAIDADSLHQLIETAVTMDFTKQKKTAPSENTDYVNVLETVLPEFQDEFDRSVCSLYSSASYSWGDCRVYADIICSDGLNKPSEEVIEFPLLPDSDRSFFLANKQASRYLKNMSSSTASWKFLDPELNELLLSKNC